MAAALTRTPAPPPLGLAYGQAPRRSAGVDALRTRCPGPSGADVLGNSPLARATLPVIALGAHPLSITFRGDGSFSGSAYAGRRGGSVVLSLVFEHASGGTSRVPVFPRFPQSP